MWGERAGRKKLGGVGQGKKRKPGLSRERPGFLFCLCRQSRFDFWSSLRAERSNPERFTPTLDCRVASLLAMTKQYGVPLEPHPRRDAIAARFEGDDIGVITRRLVGDVKARERSEEDTYELQVLMR